MLVFDLPTNLLYAKILKTFNWDLIDIDAAIDSLNPNESQLLYSRLDDPLLVNKMRRAVTNLKVDREPDLLSTIELLVRELKLISSITNCYVNKGKLIWLDNNGKHEFQLSKEDLELESSLLVSFGLRWGWELTEYIGNRVILKAEREYLIALNGCSCLGLDCNHKAFARSVIKDRSYLGLVVHQVVS